MKTILVNAASLRNTGGLTILNQFLDALPKYVGSNRYFIFMSKKITAKPIENVTFIVKNTENRLRRLLWSIDYVGTTRWIKNNNMKPDAIVSLQNTGVNIKDKFQILYFHNALWFSVRWTKRLKKSEWSLSLHRCIYRYFIKKYLFCNTSVVVQLPCMKEAFAKEFAFPSERIFVIRPDIATMDIDNVVPLGMSKEFVRFFYPAYPHTHKNHQVIFDALGILYRDSPDVCKRTRVHFTHKHLMQREFGVWINAQPWRDVVVLEPELEHSIVLSYFKSVDALLFPSMVESFGLPLVEAAQFGLPVVAADLPYSKEVLAEYEGVRYVHPEQPEQWAEAMKLICVERKRYKPMVAQTESNWKLFFNLLG